MQAHATKPPDVEDSGSEGEVGEEDLEFVSRNRKRLKFLKDAALDRCAELLSIRSTAAFFAENRS